MTESNPDQDKSLLKFMLADDTGGHVPFARALEGLSGDDAVRREAGSPHSIADVLAHMVFWQERFLRIVDGEQPGRVEHASDGWPDVAADDWPRLVERYLAGLERYRALVSVPAEAARPLVPGRDRTVGEGVVSYYLHDVHHLGQVILLRRLGGTWPPPGGGDTW